MIKKLVVLRDYCSEAYLTPNAVGNQGEAIRSLTDEVNSGSESLLSKHPEHFGLFLIGEFDTLTGEIKSCSPLLIINCVELVKKPLIS